VVDAYTLPLRTDDDAINDHCVTRVGSMVDTLVSLEATTNKTMVLLIAGIEPSAWDRCTAIVLYDIIV
jgi:hypothetical protein